MPDLDPKCTLQPLTAPEHLPSQWYLYLLRCNDGSLYTGITLDPKRRCKEHNQQASRASRYVWARRPALLVWQRAVANQRIALQLEYRLKRLTKAQKERLLQEEALWLELQTTIKTAP
ncbi:GIY-YIG nuclease family protein [Oceanisphaera pacifica]|uniref:GIY-YIG nuclease family protein n=1 Tax=Oceanisphaera pacifica TaxID=2818389 RepID=A0ABS3NDK6_9GAMM|nr:GIY-YIG nuclease family protein [Oceanisphaera pacifica]MBO1518370.1 GIY-YIG nuclease family protein [Oceanisphaera pacifica]